jgi:hypothetical protein
MCSQIISSIESDFTTPLAGEACLRSEMALHVASLSVCSCVRYFRRTEPRKIDIFVSRCLLAARSRSFLGGETIPSFFWLLRLVSWKLRASPRPRPWRGNCSPRPRPPLPSRRCMRAQIGRFLLSQGGLFRLAC